MKNFVYEIKVQYLKDEDESMISKKLIILCKKHKNKYPVKTEIHKEGSVSGENTKEKILEAVQFQSRKHQANRNL